MRDFSERYWGLALLARLGADRMMVVGAIASAIALSTWLHGL